MPRVLEVRVGPASDALDRFEATWNRLAEGRAVRTLQVLLLPDLPTLLKTLSPARWTLLRELRAAGPQSVYELARRLQRNYKNVHTDVAQLVRIGLIVRDGAARVSVPWDVVRAELALEP